MAYLNANIPQNTHRSGRSICAPLRNIMEKLKTALFLVYRLLQGVVSFFIVLWKMELSSIVSRYLRSFKRALIQKKFLDVDLMSYSYGIVLVIILLCILGYFRAQAGKYIGKDKKWHHGKYLFTVDFAHPESNILDTDHSEIPHEHNVLTS